MSIGIISGTSLPWVKDLNTELLVLIIIVFITSALGVYFLRETKTEFTLRHLYTDIYSDLMLENTIRNTENRRLDSKD
jgi:hypothetical protein